jgi:hypothetical protein
VISGLTTTSDGATVSFVPGVYTCALTPRTDAYREPFSCQDTVTFSRLDPRQTYTLHVTGTNGDDLVHWTVTVQPASGGLVAALARVQDAGRHVLGALGSLVNGVRDLLPSFVLQVLQLLAGLGLGLIRRLSR